MEKQIQEISHPRPMPSKRLPLGIFVGGTSGIGRGIAEAFARHTQGNAHIILIGRNQAAANEILSSLPNPSPSPFNGSPSDAETPIREFIHCDVSLLQNIDAITKTLLIRFRKVNFLVLTPGVLSMKGRIDTKEGIDKKLAIHYYGRWKFAIDLLPLLLQAQKEGEDAKVLSVLAAGKGGKIDIEDLGLKKHYSTTNAAMAAPTYTDLIAQELAGQHPEITFAHAYPGIVRTPLMTSADSAFLRVISTMTLYLLYPFSMSSRTAGENMLRGILQAEKGFVRLGSKGEDIGMKRFFGTEEDGKKLWEHTKEELQSWITRTNDSVA